MPLFDSKGTFSGTTINSQLSTDTDLTSQHINIDQLEVYSNVFSIHWRTKRNPQPSVPAIESSTQQTLHHHSNLFGTSLSRDLFKKIDFSFNPKSY